MNERSRGCFIAALPLVFAAFFPQTSFAQCSHAFDGILIGDMPGSPFQADVQVKSLSPEEPGSSPRQERPEHILRDSQGRVRIESGTPARTTLPRRPGISMSRSETWCSEDLGADVQRILGTVEKGTSRTATLTHIQRSEPDPAPFQIPPGYHVIEREDRPGMDWRLTGNGP